jgi:hypothetical protein
MDRAASSFFLKYAKRICVSLYLSRSVFCKGAETVDREEKMIHKSAASPSLKIYADYSRTRQPSLTTKLACPGFDPLVGGMFDGG